MSIDINITLEELAAKGKLSYIEAIVEYCEKKQLETNQVKHLINRTLKEKIRVNAEAVNLLQKTTNTLPV